ncbi:Uncharacterized protein TCM_016383 [Theobroma cacao]|uniref:Uncharacterized protein n=1 Tax=Theobroma cacao TaxID=3641 RepID=A0A061G6U2_THECC|nr:Uncharacterized protein TCM_016383 [Theobroma cacao]
MSANIGITKTSPSSCLKKSLDQDLQECEALIFVLILCLWVILLFSSLDAKVKRSTFSVCPLSSSFPNNGSELNVERERER